MIYWRKLSRGGFSTQRVITALFFLFFLYCHSALAQLEPQDVLILVNQNSPTSCYVAKMYRQYYPQIAESQVLYLNGLADCSGPYSTPADEIITRQQYNQLIANPVRSYLTEPNFPGRITQVKAIITTAGMPYRIEDTVYGDVIYPAGSNYNTVINQESSIDAASVESELTCLWYCDYDANGFGRTNRMVNPYQGYRSSVSAFPRQIPGAKGMLWTSAISLLAPLVENPMMEGVLRPPDPPKPPDFITKYYYGTVDRNFHVGDMYLTCRLDGPKNQGQSAVFAVRAMLERSRRASSPLVGVNPAQAVAVLDDAPTIHDNFDYNRTYNLTFGVEFWEYNNLSRQPPNADQCRIKEDYINAYIKATASDPENGILNIGDFALPGGPLLVALDRRNYTRTSQADLDQYAAADPTRIVPQGIIFLATFGKNGDEGNPANYLLTTGPGGGVLFNVVNGAVFTSLESFNALTMFADVNTVPVAQGKLVNFIAIGGTGAIGHSFEPQPDAAIDNEFLLYNLLADKDGDNKADLTFVEAAFTALPYISWSEVVVGDPLMRIAYGPGGLAWSRRAGDANYDGFINFKDVRALNLAFGSQLNTSDPQLFAIYNDLCDFNQDGVVNFKDVRILRENML